MSDAGSGKGSGAPVGGGRVRAHVLVSGRVQGVWFRGSAVETAERLGVAGWARNLPDGRVEAVFEGPRDAVEAAIAWCHRGPPAARVEGVEVGWEEPAGETGFRVRY
jgi:acylphosphatase